MEKREREKERKREREKERKKERSKRYLAFLGRKENADKTTVFHTSG